MPFGCPWFGYGNGGVGYGLIGLLFSLFFLGLLIVGMVLLMRWAVAPRRLAPTGTPQRSSSDSALEILRQRHAHGEMDKGEYEEKRKDLTSR